MPHTACGALAPPDYDGHFAMIPLNKGKFAIVDEDRAELVLNGRPWNATQQRTRTWYASRRDDCGETITMHVLVAGYVGVDHANRNGLDNRRINLRPATRSQNGANAGLRSDNTSGYKGVGRHRGTGKWIARIMVDGKSKYLGLFDDPVEAARAYNAAAMRAFGEYAWLNPV